MPQPGGWNRFSIEVPDLTATVTQLRRDGVRFRNNLVTGVGGAQIIAEGVHLSDMCDIRPISELIT